MSSFWTKVIGDKREWRSMEARADALPRDYRIVYAEIKPYLWKFTTGDGMDTVAVLRDVLRLFETSAADGKHCPGRHRRGRGRVLRRAPARHAVVGGQGAGVAQPRRGPSTRTPGSASVTGGDSTPC